MANPVLSREWGEQRSAASTATVDTTITSPPDSPVLDDRDRGMTFGGTAWVTGFLLAVVLVFGAWGWSLVEVDEPWPTWMFFLIFGALGVALVAIFKPRLSPFVGPVYAAIQGVLLGAISHIYEAAFNGIVLQAILATAVTFVVMLVVYATRIIRVTQRTRALIVGATISIAVFYLISVVLALFNVDIPLIWDSGIFGIGFSLVVIGVAAFNLLLDFDLIEKGVAAGAPKYMEWYAAFGLMVTIIWLYLEMLRLLGKVRS